MEDDPIADEDTEDSDGHAVSEEEHTNPQQRTPYSYQHSSPEEPSGSTAHLSPDWFPAEISQELQAPSSHTLDELPEISAVGPLADESLDTCEWPEIPPYVTAELPFNDPDYLDPISPIDSSGLWPLKSSDQAMLLQYFITDLSPWVSC